MSSVLHERSIIDLARAVRAASTVRRAERTASAALSPLNTRP